MEGDLTYPNREGGAICGGHRERPCARWKMCAKCNDIVARRTSARIHQTIQMIFDIYGEEKVMALTISLPGNWHGIRRSSIWSQYAYITGRQTLKGLPGYWPMRGLNKRLAQAGVVGGWHFFECTYNTTTKCWNAHLHCILLGSCAGWLAVSEAKVVEDSSSTDSEPLYRRELESTTSGALRGLGFGERYTLDLCATEGEIIGYCTKRAYCSKMALKGPARELRSFLGTVKPNLVRPFGRARIPLEDRIQWLLENDNHQIADVLIARREANEQKEQ